MIVLFAMGVGCAGAAKFLNQPLPEIVGQTARESFGADYKILVDCTVENTGAEGAVTVFAQLRIDENRFWIKEADLDLSEDEIRMVTVEFPEATLLDEGLTGYRYDCNVRPSNALGPHPSLRPGQAGTTAFLVSAHFVGHIAVSLVAVHC